MHCLHFLFTYQPLELEFKLNVHFKILLSLSPRFSLLLAHEHAYAYILGSMQATNFNILLVKMFDNKSEKCQQKKKQSIIE